MWPKNLSFSVWSAREKPHRPLQPICENQCGMCSVTGASCTGRSVLWRTSPSMLGNSDWQTDTLGICHSSLFKSSLCAIQPDSARVHIRKLTRAGAHTPRAAAYARLFRCIPLFVYREIQKKLPLQFNGLSSPLAWKCGKFGKEVFGISPSVGSAWCITPWRLFPSFLFLPSFQ